MSSNNIVFFHVFDDPDQSFYFDTRTQELCNSVESPACKVSLSKESYESLLNGITTFEQEATYSRLKIAGDSSLLRKMGSLLRSQIS